jgi:hypothetical protein
MRGDKRQFRAILLTQCAQIQVVFYEVFFHRHPARCAYFPSTFSDIETKVPAVCVNDKNFGHASREQGGRGKAEAKGNSQKARRKSRMGKGDLYR